MFWVALTPILNTSISKNLHILLHMVKMYMSKTFSKEYYFETDKYKAKNRQEIVCNVHSIFLSQQY